MQQQEIETAVADSVQVAEIHARLKDLAMFLSDYASELLAVGATSARVEANVERMATHFGAWADIAIFSKHIIMTVTDRETRHTYSVVGRARHRPISFLRNTSLSRMSWQVIDENLTVAQARERFDAITSVPHGNVWKVLVLTSLANMSFCYLFGGDPWALLVVFLATAVGYCAKICLLRLGIDTRGVFIMSAFCATVIGCSCYVFQLGNTPEVALGTSVLYLVPGIPFINSISDLIYGHNLCFVSRLTNASVLTICLSMGFILGLLVMRIGLL